MGVTFHNAPYRSSRSYDAGGHPPSKVPKQSLFFRAWPPVASPVFSLAVSNVHRELPWEYVQCTGSLLFPPLWASAHAVPSSIALSPLMVWLQFFTSHLQRFPTTFRRLLVRVGQVSPSVWSHGTCNQSYCTLTTCDPWGGVHTVPCSKLYAQCHLAPWLLQGNY